MASASISPEDRKLNSELKVKFKQLMQSLIKLNLLPVIDRLFEEGILCDDDNSSLHKAQNTGQQSRRLMAMLYCNEHPLTFIKLRQAIDMEPAYNFIIQQLDELKIDEVEPSKDKGVVHTLPETQRSFGVTSLDDKLYVLREKPEEQVEVYNATSHSLLRQLSVPDLEGFVDMTSCKHHRCLYIADWNSNCVHRVGLDDKVSKWSVSYTPWCLSVTVQFTVLVTCQEPRKFLEFTTEGKQLREINLQRDIVSPSHTIQLSTDKYAVCHGESGDPVHRVCIVDYNGQVTQSHGGPPGSATVGQLDEASHLAADKDGSVYVADYNNRRVLLLSPTLEFVREIVSRDQLKWFPMRLSLDADSRCLYVADNKPLDESMESRGRVVVVRL